MAKISAKSLSVALKPYLDGWAQAGDEALVGKVLKGLQEQFERATGGKGGGVVGGIGGGSGEGASGGTGATLAGGSGGEAISGTATARGGDPLRLPTDAASGGLEGNAAPGGEEPNLLAAGTIRTLSNGNDIWPGSFGDSNANDDQIRGIGGDDILLGGGGNDYLAGDSDVPAYNALSERKIIDTEQTEAKFDIAERSDGSGGFVVVWKVDEVPTSTINMELLDQNGNSREPQTIVIVADNGSDSTPVQNPVVETIKGAGANAGKIWVGYTDGFSAAGGGVATVKIFNADLSGSPSQISVPSYTSGQQVVRFWMEGTSTGEMLIAQVNTSGGPPQLRKYGGTGTQVGIPPNDTIQLGNVGGGGSNKIAMSQLATSPDATQPDVALVYGRNLQIIDPGNAGVMPTLKQNVALPGEGFGVAAMPDGSYVVGYDTGTDIVLRRYSATGVPDPAGPIVINGPGQADTVNTANDVDMAVTSDGIIIVTWADRNADPSQGFIYERAYDANLAPIFDPTIVNTNIGLRADDPNVAVSRTQTGVFAGLVAWEADAAPGVLDERDIYAAALSPIQGSGNDTLYGGEGFDTLLGGEGNDLIEGGTLADTLRGGTGVDTVDYRNSLAAVTIALVDSDVVSSVATATDMASHARGDNISGFENIIGSGFDDTLLGSTAVNSIYGATGNDSLAGGAGGDLLDGGVGTDFVTYRASSQGIYVNINTGQGFKGDASGDSVINVENVEGSNGDDTIAGTVGANVLWGLNGGDSFYAGPGADTLFGDAGNDLLRGGGDGDSLYGGIGSDVAEYANSGARVIVDLSANGAQSGGDAAGDVITGVEGVIGSDFNDILTGQNDAATAGSLFGGLGDDTLEGRAGVDTLDGGGGLDTLSYRLSTLAVTVNLATGAVGGDGAGDLITGFEHVWGGQGADDLTGDAQANTLHGDDGNDTLRASAGADRLFGGSGFDLVDYSAASGGIAVGLNDGATESGSLAQDQIVTFVEGIISGSGDDVLTGDAQANYFLTNSGADTILTGAGADTVNGGSGNDFMHDGGGAFADVFRGAAGNDVVSYANATTGVVADLSAGVGSGGDALGDSYVSIENLIGGNANDILTGDLNANYLRGQTGNDRLFGGAGADSLFGEDGNDALQFDINDVAVMGGTGRDTLLGTSSNDIVQMNVARFNFAAEFASFEVFDLGDGNDFYQGSSTAKHFEEITGAGVTIFGGSGNDRMNMRGNGANGAVNDYVDGGAGDDIMWGGTGRDTFVGGSGYDVSYGGFGNDTLAGGSGFDLHYIGRNEGNDTILGSDGDGLVLFWGHDALLQSSAFDGVDPSEINIAYGASNVTITFDTGGSVTFQKGAIGGINLFDYGNNDAGNSTTQPGDYVRDVWYAQWDPGTQTFSAFTKVLDN